MKRVLFCLVLGAAGLGCAPTPVAPLYAGGYRVDRVVDGDTVHLSKDGRTLKVRLLRIDTPERGERGYDQASRELYRLLDTEEELKLEYEGERKDQHGRDLAYLWKGDKLLNVEIVRSGWTEFFTRYGRGKYAPRFEQAEQEARRFKRGLWGRE